METLVDAASGLTKYRLSINQQICSGAWTAEIFLHGAHVTSWCDPTGHELLFLSKKAVFAPPKAIRGGIPVCWPQFSDFGPLGQHGFARNMEWQLVASGAESEHGPFVELALCDSEQTRQVWPHSFTLSLRTSLSDTGLLRQDMRVLNAGDTPLSFTTALHTYFRCNARRSRVLGLHDTEYLDSLQGRQLFMEEAEEVPFKSEVDRIYLSIGPHALMLSDEHSYRTFAVMPIRLPDAVVWNPWIAKAQAMADFGDDEYKSMVCIEAAAIQQPIVLKAGESWLGGQTLSVATFPGRG